MLGRLAVDCYVERAASERTWSAYPVNAAPQCFLSLSLATKRPNARPVQMHLLKLDLIERKREKDSLYVTPTAHGVAQGLDSAVRVIAHGRLHACIKSVTHESTSDVSRGAYDESKRHMHQRHGQRRQEINRRASALPKRCNWTKVAPLSSWK